MPTGKIKNPDLDLLCSWIKVKWDQILLELVEKSFKKSASPIALTGQKTNSSGTVQTIA